uniref:Kinase n=1 Tax=Rhizophora mucronata TaxID=61149 RepID=A0A2P2L3P0_RHIMU
MVLSCITSHGTNLERPTPIKCAPNSSSRSTLLARISRCTTCGFTLSCKNAIPWASVVAIFILVAQSRLLPPLGMWYNHLSRGPLTINS